MPEALVEALHNTLPKMDAETLGDKQGEVKVKALLNALVDTKKLRLIRFGETVGDVKDETLLNTLQR